MQILIESLLSISFIAIILYIGYVIYSSDFRSDYLYIAYSAFAIAISYSIYLIPRLLGMLINSNNMKALLGYTLMFKEIIITLFLLYLLNFLCTRYSFKRKTLNNTMYGLAALRIVLLLLPYNNWATTRSVLFTTLSVLPFLFSGTLLVLLYRQKSIKYRDESLSFFWVVIALFVFSAILEMFFYSRPYIVYPNLITIFAIYWLLYKDFSLAVYRKR